MAVRKANLAFSLYLTKYVEKIVHGSQHSYGRVLAAGQRTGGKCGGGEVCLVL